jgi:hypothetical protein
MTLTPTERQGVDDLRSDVLAQLAELRRLRARKRARSVPGLPPLRSVVLATTLVAVSAALVVAFSALSPTADDEEVAPAARSSPARSPVVAPRGTALPTFVWVSTRGATGYEFRLLRRGTPVYSARTTKPRLTLPRRWSVAGRVRRIEPGVYLWDVRPLFGARRGAITVRARLTVSS